MPRSYRHIKEYGSEILDLKGQEYILREIGEKYGFTRKQIHNFITWHNMNQRKIAAGIALKRKGRKFFLYTQKWVHSQSQTTNLRRSSYSYWWIHPFLQSWKNPTKNKTDTVWITKSVCWLKFHYFYYRVPFLYCLHNLRQLIVYCFFSYSFFFKSLKSSFSSFLKSWKFYFLLHLPFSVETRRIFTKKCFIKMF